MAFAADKAEWWQYKPFKGSYLIYSGTLGEEGPPTSADRKIAFCVNGPLAKEMFESVHLDAKNACSTDTGYRERNKGNVSCIHDANGYSCSFGFNLRTGGNISGSTC